MIKKVDKNSIRVQRHERMRAQLSGTTERPRLNVYRSTVHIYAQVIDDAQGITIASCSDMDKALRAKLEGKTKSECAAIVGQEVGKRAKAKGVRQVVFDRGGYLYAGRVQRLADGAREAGLEF